MKRREFISLLGGTAATWPLAARAEQSVMPVIGYLAQYKPEQIAGPLVAALHNGLGEAGLVEGKDYRTEFRSAGGDANLLPGLAAELVQHRVAVIMVDTLAAVRAAMTATTTIPIVFAMGADPVKAGLVASLNRPGGNVTGISTMNLDIGSKWVGLLHELLPTAKRIAILVNIENADTARLVITGVQDAAFSMGLQTEIVFASKEGEIEPAFASLGARTQALIVQPDPMFNNIKEVATLAIREKLPALAAAQEFAKVGGLMTYGSSFVGAHRLAGTYVGRILKGEKPGDLPVQRATKFDFIINLKTGKAIGIDIPPMLLARADEVIE